MKNISLPKKLLVFQANRFFDGWIIFFPLWLWIFFSNYNFAPINHFFFQSVPADFSASLPDISTKISAVLSMPALVCGTLFFYTFFSKKTEIQSHRSAFLCVFLSYAAFILVNSVSAEYWFGNPTPFFGGVSCGAFAYFSLYFVMKPSSPKCAAAALIGVILAASAAAVCQFKCRPFAVSNFAAECALVFGLSVALSRLLLGRLPVKTAAGPFTLNQNIYNGFIAAYWVIVCNLPFFAKAAENLNFSAANTLLLAVMAGILWCGFFAVLTLLYFPIVTKTVALVLSAMAVSAFYFNVHFGTVINSEMMRNVLATDYAETSELVSLDFVLEYLFLLAPVIYLTFLTRLKPNTPLKTAALTSFSLLLGLLLLYQDFQGISSLIRSVPVTRNLITPVNVISSTYNAIFKEGNTETAKPREVIDPNPKLGSTHNQKRGELFVVVVGETARLANWGLAGYHRNTTPELASRDVYAFDKTVACGTSTDVSLPCMFSRVGRANYDRKKILSEESLLPLLQRAGLKVYWVDNQSGCKGVCKGVDVINIQKNKLRSLCHNGQCFDEALLAGLDTSVLPRGSETTVIFMHQLGNHGPAYFKRYPKNFEVFKPVCKSEKLNSCTQEEIVNAYDNALLYTDHFLAGLIDWLQGQHGIDTGLLYVSDHGESLGENHLFLHGAPEMIAPKEQKEVPMLLWLSKGMKQRIGLDENCFRQVLHKDASHDQLFSSLLGLLDVKSAQYNSKLDFTAACRIPDESAFRKISFQAEP